MRRAWWIWGAIAVVAIMFLRAIGSSPMPPSGPMGASVVEPSAARAKVVSATRDWLAAESGGFAIQFYNFTWEGGQTARGSYPNGTAFYTGFKGIILVGHWPFILSYGGTVNENPDVGYVVKAHIDGLGIADQKPESLTPVQQQRVLGMIRPALAASGVGISYDFAQVSTWASINSDTTGALDLTAKVPPRVPSGPEGALTILLSSSLSPVDVSLVMPAK